MYTGQLEYWTSEQNALYRTAQRMNMTVLTKLLDAQFNTSGLQTSPTVPLAKTNVQPIMVPQKYSSPTKKIVGGASQLGTLPTQPLPGRKLPIWKRKLDSHPTSNYDQGSYNATGHRQNEQTPGPSRFDLPEVEDFALGVFSSFDDITYNTKPIVQAPENNPSRFSSFEAEKNDTLEKNDKFDRFEKNDRREISADYDEKFENSDDDWTATKSILRGGEIHQPSPSKKVRFELEEKENMERARNASSNDEAINNHAKIIREVLKKYPHLVKNNKNIRLKIMQKESKSPSSLSPSKTKVSYVVLKSDHLMRENTSPPSSQTQNTGSSSDLSENGPWKCRKCDLNDDYTNYYMFRRHMQDVHDEKFDPRVCEHCGYKATKRNILMYHLYTKHNVSPPRSMSFPKCPTCNYVALSETLLVRHQINHNHRPASSRMQNDLEKVSCIACSQTFADVNELAAHEINSGHGNGFESKEKGNRCPYCGKNFVRVTNLRIHLDCAHKNERSNDSSGHFTREAVSTIVLEPSSEAEALSNVASGIAASLGVGCDVINPDNREVIDDNQVYPICDGEIRLSGLESQEIDYNGREIVETGDGMIMLIDGENYRQHTSDNNEGNPRNFDENMQNFDENVEACFVEAKQQSQPPHQLEITGNEQIVMQGTEEGMIVYIHGNENNDNDVNTFEGYQTVEIDEGINEEFVEEVEEVVEEVEEFIGDDNAAGGDSNFEMNNGRETILVDGNGIVEECGNIERIEEMIQYVEEETQIVEYDEEGDCRVNSEETQEEEEQQQDDSAMIVDEENVKIIDVDTRSGDKNHREYTRRQAVDHERKNEGRDLADEWDDDSADVVES